MRDTTIAWIGSFLVRIGVLIGVLLCGAGCAMMLSEATPPEVRQVIVPTSLDATYHRAQRAASTMGAVMLAQDTEHRTFTAKVRQVVGLHVDVRTVEKGTQMTVTGSILPQHLAVGTMSAVDEFILAYRKEQL